MRIYKLFYIFYKIKLFSPVAIFRLFFSINKYGVNLMALLAFSAKTYGEKIAIADEQQTLTYHQLFTQSGSLSLAMREHFQLERGKRVGILCRNHTSLVKTIYAVSYSGADLFLLNTELSKDQLYNLLEQKDFDLLIYDQELSLLVEQSTYKKAKLLSYDDTFPAINNLLSTQEFEYQKNIRTNSGKLVLLTGGTTGNAKEAMHKPSLFNYLDPFAALLSRLELIKYDNIYIATPIFHGYGIAILLLFGAIGKKVIIQRKFHAEKACELINEHHVQVITVVPLMLYKMLMTNAKALTSLTCIASGSAELNPKLVKATISQLGNVLYNLYGTSEAGLTVIAKPEDLIYSPHTIGRKIEGVNLEVLDEHKRKVTVGKVGQLCIRSKFLSRSNSSWIETGDLGYRDERGYYYLCGRIDSMIVSAGENVYPVEVEQVLLTHSEVEAVAVVGVSDEQFGQRLKAYVQLVPGAVMTPEELQSWLRARLARFQMPKEIVFIDEMPYTAIGKLDKKQLN
ncbi:AMP-binding protein [Paenibacillus endoradicis]|uniref:AMP-binding protein n=1 Tax=Paenibacillus endoradicis TaxID=2972487 RepID=UPI002158F72D|nr:AMP-binding protein [Paenibacillus endoradicis]MCR8657658.1 AMP-binding protein [Paenibacillus endoradicis]